MAGGRGPIVQCRPMPRGIARWPHPPCHVTDPCEGLHTASPPLIQVSLIQRMMLSCLGSTGPLSYTWRGPNRPPNRLTSWETNLPTMHLPSRGHPSPLDGEAVQWTVGQPWPTSADTPPPHLRLQVPPCPLHTIKRVVVLGGDHHSAPLKHSKCSKLSEALQE